MVNQVDFGMFEIGKNCCIFIIDYICIDDYEVFWIICQVFDFIGCYDCLFVDVYFGVFFWMVFCSNDNVFVVNDFFFIVVQDLYFVVIDKRSYFFFIGQQLVYCFCLQ